MDKKPHHVIKQYRLYTVAIVAFFMWMAASLLEFIETHHASMSEAAAAGVIGLAVTVVGAMVKSLEVINKRVEQDDD